MPSASAIDLRRQWREHFGCVCSGGGTCSVCYAFDLVMRRGGRRLLRVLLGERQAVEQVFRPGT